MQMSLLCLGGVTFQPVQRKTKLNPYEKILLSMSKVKVLDYIFEYVICQSTLQLETERL